MAVLDIVTFPNELLHKPCELVHDFNHETKELVNNMKETLHVNNGIGLAAPQVGVLKQIFLMDIDGSTNGTLVFINPMVIASSNVKTTFQEGCLSFPGLFFDVQRLTSITVRAQDADGNFFERILVGLPAICAQHELDHLRGKLFTETLSIVDRAAALKTYGAMRGQEINENQLQ